MYLMAASLVSAKPLLKFILVIFGIFYMNTQNNKDKFEEFCVAA
tara:strand:+ start:16160 stop:16291 length:132 start_codon:yes stop_codon:yes gene_type:complete